jgi:hypothetical protein
MEVDQDRALDEAIIDRARRQLEEISEETQVRPGLSALP